MKGLTLNGYLQSQSVYTYKEESHKGLTSGLFYSIVRLADLLNLSSIKRFKEVCFLSENGIRLLKRDINMAAN